MKHMVSSAGRAPVCWTGSRGFKPRSDQHSGSLNNLEESAGCKRLEFLVFSDKYKNP